MSISLFDIFLIFLGSLFFISFLIRRNEKKQEEEIPIYQHKRLIQQEKNSIRNYPEEDFIITTKYFEEQKPSEYDSSSWPAHYQYRLNIESSDTICFSLLVNSQAAMKDRNRYFPEFVSSIILECRNEVKMLGLLNKQTRVLILELIKKRVSGIDNPVRITNKQIYIDAVPCQDDFPVIEELMLKIARAFRKKESARQLLENNF